MQTSHVERGDSDRVPDVERLREENAHLRRQAERRTWARLERAREWLRPQNEHLKRQPEEARRAAHRQAAPAPCAKALTRDPRRLGRKPGRQYGMPARRRRSRRVDESSAAPLPRTCPSCGGGVRETGVALQYQEELPLPRVVVRRFRIRTGRCSRCHLRVQGRYPLQTSDAPDATRAQLGAQAIGFAVILNRQLGLSFGKIATLVQQYRLRITRSGLVHRAAWSSSSSRCSSPTAAASTTPFRPRAHVRAVGYATGNGNGGQARADISIYGKESNCTTWRLPKMNLAIRGIGSEIAPGDTFHSGRFCDFERTTAAAVPDNNP